MSSAQASTQFSIIDSVTGKETTAEQVTDAPNSDYAVHYGAKRPTDPSGNEWTHDSLSNQRQKIVTQVAQQGKNIFRTVGQNIEFVSAPAVVDITFSPSDTFEYPSDPTDQKTYYINWVYDDLENSPQTSWEVKIYSDAIYNTAGFSPDTTPLENNGWIWQGNDNSSSIAINPNIGLVGGNRYWAFVKVGKTFGGASWFSEWAHDFFQVYQDHTGMPIVSVYANGSNATNQIAIQSTDNLFSDGNGSITSTPSWAITAGTTSNFPNAFLERNVINSTLGQPLSTGQAITSLPIGAIGYTTVSNLGALSGTGTGTFKVFGSPTSGDPLGFPLPASGNFWVTLSPYLVIGSTITGSGIPSSTTITAVSGNRITLSSNATATSSSVSLTVNSYAFTASTTSGSADVYLVTERVLVSNNADGNNSGDTFTIVTRGYPVVGLPASTAVSWTAPLIISYGLQKQIVSGSSGTIQYSEVVQTTEVRYKTVAVAVRPTSGSLKTTTKTVFSGNATNLKVLAVHNDGSYTIHDPNGVLKRCVGNKVPVSIVFNNKTILTSGSGSQTPATVQSMGPYVKTGFHIKSAKSLAYTPAPVTVAKVNKSFYSNLGAPLSRLSVDEVTFTIPGNFAMTTTINSAGFTWATNTQGAFPAGTKFKIKTRSSAKVPNWPSSIPANSSMDITLSAEFKFNITQKSGLNNIFGSSIPSVDLHLKPTKQFGSFNFYTDPSTKKPNSYIPVGAEVVYAVPTQNVAKVKVRIDGLAAARAQGFSLSVGDYIQVGASTTHVVTTGGGSTTTKVPYTVNGQTVTPHTQLFIVDRSVNSPQVGFYNGSYGTYSGSTFTPATGSTNFSTINAIRFTNVTDSSITANQYQNYTLQGGDFPAGTTVSSNTAYSTGTVVFVVSASPTIRYTGLNSDLSPANPVLTADITLYNYQSFIIPAGSTSIPIAPMFPDYGYPQYSSVTFGINTKIGNSAIAINNGGTLSGTNRIDASIYPQNGWSGWNSSNSIAVNAGTTYGFSSLVTAPIPVAGTAPTYAQYIDWYDEYNNLITTSDGTQSLVTGVTNAFDPTVTIGFNNWTPNVIVAKAPNNYRIGTATGYTPSSTQGIGTYSVSGGLAISLTAGSLISTSNGAQLRVNSNVSQGGTSITVTFLSGSPTSTDALYISATRACPRFSVTNLSILNPITAFSGFLFQALTPPNPNGNYTALNTCLPSLTYGINPTTGASQPVKSFVIPNNTPLNGALSTYLFDPTNDNGSRELQVGGGTNFITPPLVASASAGATSIQLTSVQGLARNGVMQVGYNSPLNEETVTISSTWDGSQTVTLALPLINTHLANELCYATVASTESELQNAQSAGTPVAVMNWNSDTDGFVGGVPSYTFKAERSEDSGNNWTTLRGAEALTVSNTGIATVSDYDAIPTVSSNLYRFTPSVTTGSVPQIGFITPPLTAPALITSTWWLGSTSDPNVRYPILVQNGVQETQKHPAGVFYPLGSSRPFTIAGVVQGRDATIDVIWTDIPNWTNFLNLLNKGETLILLDPVEAERRYIFVNEDVKVTHNAAASPYRTVSITYVEAAPPNYGFTYGS